MLAEVETPRVVNSVEAVRRDVAAARKQGAIIGLVPTMGALHTGHLSLIEAARRDCDFVVVSIFVNPTQFGPHEDFGRYPRPLETDLQACRTQNVDLVFHPEKEIIYPDGFCTVVDVTGLSTILEGKFRPGHFQGVSTVVLKLLNIVTPDVAYFGQKDYQQQLIIRRMCRELDLGVTIRTCPTIREPDGLALSSRNVYLSADEREAALSLSRSLQKADELIQAGERNLDTVRRQMQEILKSASGVEIDYATVVHSKTLEEIDEAVPKLVAIVAARVGTTRLIDNLLIEH